MGNNIRVTEQALIRIGTTRLRLENESPGANSDFAADVATFTRELRKLETFAEEMLNRNRTCACCGETMDKSKFSYGYQCGACGKPLCDKCAPMYEGSCSDKCARF